MVGKLMQIHKDDVTMRNKKREQRLSGTLTYGQLLRKCGLVKVGG